MYSQEFPSDQVLRAPHQFQEDLVDRRHPEGNASASNNESTSTLCKMPRADVASLTKY